MGLEGRKGPMPVMTCLRQATGELHQRLEERFDAVAELADPSRRPATIGRYAALYSSAHAMLAAILQRVEGLDFLQRARPWRPLRAFSARADDPPAFPVPGDLCEALGSFYVVEGSTLGGRIILRELRARGVTEPELSFLDPYGAATGQMWRSLLEVLEREGSRGPGCLESMCRGATRGFLHAERVLCGETR